MIIIIMTTMTLRIDDFADHQGKIKENVKRDSYSHFAREVKML